MIVILSALLFLFNNSANSRLVIILSFLRVKKATLGDFSELPFAAFVETCISIEKFSYFDFLSPIHDTPPFLARRLVSLNLKVILYPIFP